MSPPYLAPEDVSRAFVAAHFDAAGAETTLDAALRIDSTIMLVDDPVKRVDNMTMAWGLEGRVPFLDHELVELAAACPPALKLANGGKGVLKAAARALLPAEVIDRPKGYFPVPGIRHLEGPFLETVRDALTNPAARARGLFRQDYVERLFRVTQRALQPGRQHPVAARPPRALAAAARRLNGLTWGWIGRPEGFPRGPRVPRRKDPRPPASRTTSAGPRRDRRA